MDFLPVFFLVFFHPFLYFLSIIYNARNTSIHLSISSDRVPSSFNPDAQLWIATLLVEHSYFRFNFAGKEKKKSSFNK